MSETRRTPEAMEAHDNLRSRIDQLERELASERERAALAIEELRNISTANWMKWDDDCRSQQNFVDWAKSRAMFTLNAIGIPHPPQEETK